MEKYLQLCLIILLGPIALGQFADDMESYSDGEPIDGIWWLDFCNSGPGCSLMASSDVARSGALSGMVPGDTTTNVALDLGNKYDDLWHLEFWMYVPSNKEAYWRIKGCVPTCTENWYIDFYFNLFNGNPGVGEVVHSPLGTLEFFFPHDTWFEVRMNVDLSEGMSEATWQLTIDGEEIIPCETPYTTETGEVPTFLGGIEFYSISSDHLLYLDDIVYNNIPDACSPFTEIPDPNFEQALIDLGIDSDGIVNGQVLTDDIEEVLLLDVSYSNIQDLTGIEDFTALEILNIDGNYLSSLNVSNNLFLREMYCSSDSAGFNMLISDLDLSNNNDLQILYGENLIFLESLNAQNGNNAILTITLPCEFEGKPCNLTDLHCVQVDDESAANNNEPPYDTWFIQANFIYSEDCTLGVATPIEDMFSFYPNPVKDILTIQNQNGLEIDSVTLYDTLGRKVLEKNEATESIDVSNLTTGIYFIHITTAGGVVTKKISKA